ncbi:probable cytochrome P450 6a14 isoform X2 [Frieseomelitta varia]|uniref:probable cytochrome P450 6a14 isoform X2 n=1 Tax=Frieseomelitta varia TaxID=561572 RepID=UPI001CB6B16C|nr:probable cytochrome P450 6a14 isoform X2 [Frieseomelitta varia]
MDLVQLLLAVVAVCLAIYYYYQSKYEFWRARGVPGPKPRIYIGNFIDVLTKKRAICTIVKDLYDEFKKEPIFGIYEGTTPVLVINDLDAIKDVLIRDFSVFVDRGFHVFTEADPLSQHLFLLEPKRWRPLRVKLSPIFTSGKLKEMFPLVVECAGNLEKYLDKVTKDGTPVECRDLAAKFTIDVIGSCVFGISAHALEDENSEFRKMGKRISTSSTKQRVREAIMQFMPSVYEVIGHFLQMKDIDAFFINLVRDTMRYRKENNVIRPDFIHMLMELKEHPEKVDSIETLRKYPILSMLNRRAIVNYTFRDMKITIPKGTKIWIPVYGIQHDPNIYPDPEKFDPERFNDDAAAARHPMSFLPFGDGPRNCIGARFAHYQSKVGLATILRNYKVDVCEKTTIPYEVNKFSFLMQPNGGVNLKLTRA